MRKGYECYDEVFTIDDEGYRRFSDIVSFSKNISTTIIHPTINYDTNDQKQCKLVQQRKQSIYEKRETYYNSKFSQHYIVVVDLGFTTLLTSQVISVAFYSEREKFDKFSSEALISVSGFLPVANLRHETLGFTSLSKEVILRIFTL